MTNLLALVLILSCLTLQAALARAGTLEQPKPLYELGLTMGAFEVPDYPGANQSKVRYLGLPFGFYRGRFFRADREGGVRGQFVERDRVELDVSVSAAFPADSEDNNARLGMPDLDWIAEVGPRLVIHLIDDSWQKLDFKLPLRMVFSTNFSRLDDRGLLLPPTLDYTYRQFFSSNTKLHIRTGLLFGSRPLTKYFYEVSPPYATSERPVYRAKQGFMGTRFGLAFTHKFGNHFWLVGAVGYDLYRGVANESSPLLKANTTQTVAIGMAWTFYESDELAGSWM